MKPSKNFIILAIYGFLISLIGLFVSCSKADNTLKVSFSRACKDDSNPVRIYDFQITSGDSIFFSKQIPSSFSPQDTLKLDSLPKGHYQIKYYDITGRSRVKEIGLIGGEEKRINIVFDSIDTSDLLNKTPIKNLKEGESYMIDWKGGDVAAMYGYYKVRKFKGEIYFQTVNYNVGILTKEEIKGVMKYEAELLAMQNLNTRKTLSSITYTIKRNSEVTKIVVDPQTWEGWHCTIGKILRSRFE